MVALENRYQAFVDAAQTWTSVQRTTFLLDAMKFVRAYERLSTSPKNRLKLVTDARKSFLPLTIVANDEPRDVFRNAIDSLALNGYHFINSAAYAALRLPVDADLAGAVAEFLRILSDIEYVDGEKIAHMALERLACESVWAASEFEFAQSIISLAAFAGGANAALSMAHRVRNCGQLMPVSAEVCTLLIASTQPSHLAFALSDLYTDFIKSDHDDATDFKFFFQELIARSSAFDVVTALQKLDPIKHPLIYLGIFGKSNEDLFEPVWVTDERNAKRFGIVYGDVEIITPTAFDQDSTKSSDTLWARALLSVIKCGPPRYIKKHLSNTIHPTGLNVGSTAHTQSDGVRAKLRSGWTKLTGRVSASLQENTRKSAVDARQP